MRKAFVVVFAVFLAAMMLGFSMAAPNAPAVVNHQDGGKDYGLLSPVLFKKLSALGPSAGNEEINVVIGFNDMKSKNLAVSILEKSGLHFKIKYNYETLPDLALSIRVSDLMKISGLAGDDSIKLPGLRVIEEDYTLKAAELRSDKQMEVDKVWDAGYDGDGVVIAVIDTGIDANHPDLKGKVVGWVDFVNGRPSPYDDNGHGTHVSGIAAGTGAASNGKYIGVAPKAKLVGVKVLNSQGSGLLSTILKGVDWVIKNKDKYGIKVINLSLGSNQNGDGTDELSRAVDRAWEEGIVVCIAAGNSGPDKGTVSIPGVAKKVITVGAVDFNDKIAWFSSRGPTTDGRIKPEVVAPGVDITAPKANSDGYVQMSGTSMATPHVSGVAALLIQAHPNWSPDKIKKVLIETADIVAPNQIAGIAYGAGRVNAYRALRYDNLTVKHFEGSVSDGQKKSHSFNVKNASFVSATLFWDNASANLDLYLYDPNGNLADKSTSEYYGFEKAGAYNPTEGTWKVVVESVSGNANYEVDVVIDGQGGEPNPGPGPGPGPNPHKETKTFEGSLSSGDSATHTMTVKDGATEITGDLEVGANSLGYLNLYLYDPNGNLVDRSAATLGMDGHVKYDNPASGDWNFRVYAFFAFGKVNYKLVATVEYGS